MVDLKIDFSGPFAEVEKLNNDVRIADKRAMKSVSESLVVPAMKRVLSFTGPKAPIGELGTRTGRLRSQVRAKFWKGRDGLANAAVKVIGDRDFVSRINEHGAKSHGRHASRQGGETREAARARAA